VVYLPNVAIVIVIAFDTYQFPDFSAWSFTPFICLELLTYKKSFKTKFTPCTLLGFIIKAGISVYVFPSKYTLKSPYCAPVVTFVVIMLKFPTFSLFSVLIALIIRLYYIKMWG